MKKRFLALLLAVVMALSLAACSNDPVDTETTDTVDTTPQIPETIDWVIVYAEDRYGWAQEAAEVLAAELKASHGVDVPVVTDAAAEVQYEILVGDTNRNPAEFASDKLEVLQYQYGASGNKIAVVGELYLLEKGALELAGKLAAAEKTGGFLEAAGNGTTLTFEFEETTSFVVIIGDGFGPGYVEWSRENLFADGLFAADLMPYSTYVTTVDSVGGVTDSGASATAMATGYKTTWGHLGMLSDDRTAPKNIAELATEYGKNVGIYTNDDIYGGTPGGFTVHIADRWDTDAILAAQAELPYDMEGDLSDETLSETFKEKLEAIGERSENGFFMMFEDLRFDHCMDDYESLTAALTTMDTIAKYAIDYVIDHPDTFVIMTADHDTGGFHKDEESGEWAWVSSSHTDTPVMLFAMGYSCESFNVEQCDNTEISKFMAYSMGERRWGQRNIRFTLPMEGVGRDAE